MAIRIEESPNVFVDVPDFMVQEPSGAWYSVPELDATEDSGAWVRVWPEKLYLYKEGNEYTSVTGGWAETPTTTKSTWWDNIGINSKGTIKKVKNPDGLYLYVNSNKDSTAHASFHTKEKIDITKYEKLCMEIENPTMITNIVGTGSNGISLLVTGTDLATNGVSGGESIVNKAFTETIAGKVLVEVDVSNLSGAYYVQIGAWSWLNGAHATIKQVWLEA